MNKYQWPASRLDEKEMALLFRERQITGRINGLVFTIYDYKSKLDPERNTDWHIGGKHKFTAELLNLYFKAHSLQ